MAFLMGCVLCTLDLIIVTSPDGTCRAIIDRQSGTEYPCTEENMADTGCWDDVALACGASWVELYGISE